MDRSAPRNAAPRRFASGRVVRKAQRGSFAKGKSTFARVIRTMLAAIAVISITAAALLVHSYRSYAKLVDDRLQRGYLVSRGGIYAAPRILRPGQKVSPDNLVSLLRRTGYFEGTEATAIWNGSFTINADGIEIRTNNWDSDASPSAIQVRFENGRIADLTSDGVSMDSFTLSPESITNDALTKGGARRQLTFNDIPPVLVHAITSIEDHRFFYHHGLDIFGVARALFRNVGEDRVGQGGSTITQQLVKNTYLTPERTLRRKYAEAMLAFTLERRLSKEDIFALYCNELYLGQRGAFAVRGVDQAARVYFGKRLADLTVGEAATIAGMIQSPSRYSPAQHNEDARARRNTVLGAMVRDGFLSAEEAGQKVKEPLSTAEFDPAKESSAPYFIDYVNRSTESRPVAGEYPANANKRVVTTLDLDLQQLATQAIQDQLKHLDQIYQPRGLTPQAALVALDPKTGNVLAMIGGRDYAVSQLNRATDAQRQPGSTFKPFVYAAALETGMSPLEKFTDAPKEFTYAGKMRYRPSNYGGAFSMHDVTMRTGLVKSLNVVTVDVAFHAGLARVANTASDFGLPRPVPYPAMALGTSEVTPLQMAASYATFANGGSRVQAHAVDLPDARAEARQVIRAETAFIVTDMLEAVINEGTARAARGSIPGTVIAGKTGTSRDGWFVGYTPNLVCAVWVGFDDHKQLGLTGAEAALPIWRAFMKGAVDLRPELGGRSFQQPDDVTIIDIDPETEEVATSKCPMHERLAILKAQAPATECLQHNIYFDFTTDQVTLAANMPAEIQPLRKSERYSDESTFVRNTRIEIDNNGRKVLMSEMRAARQ